MWKVKLHFLMFSLCFRSAGMPEGVFNLREENKQLRKAHHDIHMQLQDAQVGKDWTVLTSSYISTCFFFSFSFFDKHKWFIASLLLHFAYSDPASGPEGSPRSARTDAARPQECAGCSSGRTAPQGFGLLVYCSHRARQPMPEAFLGFWLIRSDTRASPSEWPLNCLNSFLIAPIFFQRGALIDVHFHSSLFLSLALSFWLYLLICFKARPAFHQCLRSDAHKHTHTCTLFPSLGGGGGGVVI